MDEKKNPFKKGRFNHDTDDFFEGISPRRSFGLGNMFDEFEEQFRRMQQYINNAQQQNEEQKEGHNPNVRVYGYRYSRDPDGKTHFQEFGNMPQNREYGLPQKQTPTIEEKERLIDVQEAEKEIYVTAELPGINKQDINLTATDDHLIIAIQKDGKTQEKEVKLPAPVHENKTEATFNNGVLSITLKKRKTKNKRKGSNINID